MILKKIPIKPAISKDASSFTPEDIAARKPIADYSKGIMATDMGGLLAGRRAPMVKMVVGHLIAKKAN